MSSTGLSSVTECSYLLYSTKFNISTGTVDQLVKKSRKASGKFRMGVETNTMNIEYCEFIYLFI